MTHYVAQPFVAGTPNAEVIGQLMISFTNNIEAHIVQPILDSYNPRPDRACSAYEVKWGTTQADVL